MASSYSELSFTSSPSVPLPESTFATTLRAWSEVVLKFTAVARSSRVATSRSPRTASRRRPESLLLTTLRALPGRLSSASAVATSREEEAEEEQSRTGCF